MKKYVKYVQKMNEKFMK